MAHVRNRNTQILKAIRKEESDSEDEGFIGFKTDDTIENRVWVDSQVSILHALAGPSTDNSDIKVVSVIKSISEEEHFFGFEQFDTIKNKLWAANQVCILRKKQRVLDEYALTGASKDNSDISEPIPTPREESDSENITQVP